MRPPGKSPFPKAAIRFRGQGAAKSRRLRHHALILGLIAAVLAPAMVVPSVSHPSTDRSSSTTLPTESRPNPSAYSNGPIRDYHFLTTQLPAYSGIPTWLAYDHGTRSFFVAESNSTVDVIPAGSPTIAATISVGTSPFGVAYDPADGRIFVANSGSANLSVISDATNRVIGSVSVGLRPCGVAYDNATGNVFVANGGSNSVSVLSARTLEILATVPVGTGPLGIAYDPVGGNVFVANEASGNVTVLSGTTYATVSTVPAGVGPYGVAVDSDTGEAYVSNFQSGSVTVINPSGSAVVATVAIGGTPEGLAYNSKNRTIWVADGMVDVIVINASSHRIPQDLLFDPAGATYDPDRNEMCVTNSAKGTFQCLIPWRLTDMLNVTFNESGLSPGTRWNVSVDGTEQTSQSSSIQFQVITYRDVVYDIGPVSGYAANSSHGGFHPSQRPHQWIAFTPSPGNYTVTFVENGLVFEPWTILSWGVGLSQARHDSTTTTFSLAEGNGSYLFTVETVPGFDSPPFENFTVRGADLSVAVNYSAPMYSVTFEERGLDPGKSWNVTLAGATERSDTSSIAFLEPNGTFAYSIDPVSGYRLDLALGNVTVYGSGAVVTVTFTSELVGADHQLFEWYGSFAALGAVLLIGAWVVSLLRRRGKAPPVPNAPR